MLFSSREVAGFINDTFEPAWESVRPAPQVTIDFGNGQVVRRTLRGNIATYVCGPDGVVYDVLPGIYDPAEYRKQLEALKALADSLRPVRAADTRVARLQEYHATKAAALERERVAPPVQAFAQFGGGFKGGGGVGGGFQGGFGGGGAGFKGNFPGGNFGRPMVGGGQFGGFSGGGGAGFGGIEGPTERVIAGLPPGPGRAPAPAVPLAARPELALDGQANELVRRKAVHDKLSREGAVQPDGMKKWLYKEVLHVDLDDPLLGLGGVLTENYPFAEEDKPRKGGG